jgi:hypothetical protein
MVICGVGATSVEAQVSGRVVFQDGPVAVDVVFGPRHPTAVEVPRVVRRPVAAPVRYRAGMSLVELDRYLERIELEYDLFRHMGVREAWYRFGWTRDQLRSYVRFLRDERRFLRAERERLLVMYRAPAPGRRDEHPGRGRGRGQGKGIGVGLAYAR